MTLDEVARRAFRDAPTASVATIGPDGWPHVVPLWFVWLEDAIYVATRVAGSTWNNVERDGRVALVVDRGLDWTELTGIHVEGRAEAFRAEHPDLRGAMSAWHEKHRGRFAGDGFERFAAEVPALGFLRVEPLRYSTWDHTVR